MDSKQFAPGGEHGPVAAALVALTAYDAVVRANYDPATWDTLAAVAADDTGEVFGEVIDTAHEALGERFGEEWREAVDVDTWHDRYVSPLLAAYKAAMAAEVADRDAAAAEAARGGSWVPGASTVTVAGLVSTLADYLVAGGNPSAPVVIGHDGGWQVAEAVRLPDEAEGIAAPTLEAGRTYDTRTEGVG